VYISLPPIHCYLYKNKKHLSN